MLGEQDFQRFHEPDGEAVPLRCSPRLESWDARGHPAQIALRHYLDEVEVLLDGRLTEQGDLGIKLTVGLPEENELTGGGRDLDNYLYPLVRRLSATRFRTAWATKTYNSRSYVTINTATATIAVAGPGWCFASAECAASAQSTAWKQAIFDQMPTGQVDSPALDLQIAFRVGLTRNWAALWKPAIDALGPILGIEDVRHPFRPRDDRIVRLGLHRDTDATLGHRVQLGVWWRPAPEHHA